MELQPLPRPLGNWLLKQTDVAFRNFHDGAYWHYQHVLTLLKRYHEEQCATTPVEGPWKVNAYHEAAHPESGCSGDEVITITDGKVTLFVRSDEDDDGEQKLVNLLNDLKIGLDYDHSAEHVASYLQERLKQLEATPPTGAVWVRASEQSPKVSGSYWGEYGGIKQEVIYKPTGIFITLLGRVIDSTLLLWLDESSPAPTPTAFAEWVGNDWIWNGDDWTERGANPTPARKTTAQLYVTRQKPRLFTGVRL